MPFIPTKNKTEPTRIKYENTIAVEGSDGLGISQKDREHFAESLVDWFIKLLRYFKYNQWHEKSFRIDNKQWNTHQKKFEFVKVTQTQIVRKKTKPTSRIFNCK